MKKFIILFIALFFGYYSYSQSPQKFTYQSIVRKADGSILKTSSLGMRISILKNSKTGNSVYSETHTVSTNKNGLATLLIGDGTSSDTFSEIDWALGEYFLKVEVDPTGGINYSIEQSSQLLSVPYSFYSSSSANIDLTEDVLKILPIENGGTGSATAPMVSVITAANASVARDSLGLGNIAIQDKASVNLEGGTIDGTSIGTTTASTGSFTILSIASSAASSGSLKLLEAIDNGNNDITLKSPNDLTASISWTLPSSDGSDGQLLKTDGSGTLSFMTISSDSIEDAESDTKIQVEETADENIIRFDIGVDDVAVEQLVLADGILKPTTTNDIDLGSSTLGFKNAYIDGTVTSAALAVAGASTLTGNVAAAGDLAVAGASTLTGNVAASGDLAVAGASTLTGNVAASGDLAVAGASTLTGNVAASGDLAVAGASTLTGNVIAEGSVDITGAAGLILEKDQTITNSTDGTVLITSPITKMSAALEVVGATTLSGGLSLSSATASNPVVEIKNTTADASAGILKLTKDRGAAGVAGDDAGLIQFFGEDDGENPVMFSEIKSEANVVTDGEEGGKFTVSVASNDGTSTDGLIIIDGDAAGELDVTIGAGASSVLTTPGNLAVAGTSTLTGNVAAAGDLAVAGASTLTGNVIAKGSVDITGAAGLILENDETITNSTNGTVLITSPITKMSAALEVVGATTLSGGLSLSSAIASNPVLEIKNTIGDNATSGILQFVKAKTTLSSDDDDAGVILFKADNTAVEQISFGKILVEVSEADDTDEAGKLSLSVASSNGTNSSLTDGLVLTGSPSDGKVDVTIGAGASGVLTTPGNIAVAGTSTLTGNVAAAGDLAVAGASTLTGNVVAAGSVDITGAGGLILENDQTITNSTNGTILITAPITKMSAALEVVGATTLSGGLSLSSATASNPVVEIKNTTADASAGILKLTKDRGAAGVAGDDAGLIQFFGEDDGENAVMFSEIKSEANVVTDGEEGGKFTVSVASNDGTSTDGLIIVDGSEAGELDVTIGAGANSNVIVPGNIAVVGSIGAVGDIAAAGTLVAIGDTSAGDDGAIGRTAAEGLILTGQGTTNDITIKNDADATVLEIPTGTTSVVVAGSVATGGDLVVTGNDITFGNSETISNSTDNTILITSTTTRVSGALNVEGSLDLDSSINAGDYNKVAGRVTLSSTTTTVTNSYVTSTSLIMLTWASDITDKDSALRVWINAQSAGSFTIKTSANASGEKINFLVIN